MDVGSDPYHPAPSSFDSPHIFDSDTNESIHHVDLEFFNSALPQDSPTRFFGEDTLANSPFQSPQSMKQQVVQEKPITTTNRTNFSASPDSSVQDSSSETSRRHNRDTSSKTSHSGLTGQDVVMTDDVQPHQHNAMFDFSSSVPLSHHDYSFSNRAMENDFDFDSAASSPSPQINSHAPTYTGPRHIAIPYQASSKSSACLVPIETSPNVGLTNPCNPD